MVLNVGWLGRIFDVSRASFVVLREYLVDSGRKARPLTDFIGLTIGRMSC